MPITWDVEAIAHGLTQTPSDTAFDKLLEAGASTAQADTELRTLRLHLAIHAETLTEAVERATKLATTMFDQAQPGLRLVDLRVREEEVPTEDDHLLGYGRLGFYLGVSRQRAAKIAKAHPEELPPYAYRDGYPLYTTAAVDTFVQGWSRKAGRPKTSDTP